MIQAYKRARVVNGTSTIVTDFSQNGDVVLQPTACTVKAEVNGSWVLSMTHPIDDEGRWEYIEEEGVLKVPTWVGVWSSSEVFTKHDQLFRISKLEKKDKSVKVTAYPIFFDARNEGFILSKKVSSASGADCLAQLLSVLPDDPNTPGQKKYLCDCDITARRTAAFERRNFMDCLNGSTQPSFTKVWGGEISYDNYKLIVREQLGVDKGVEIRYGKNLLGIEYAVDYSGVVTRIYPLAYNEREISGSTKWVDSPIIGSYGVLYVKTMTFQNIKLLEDVQEDEDTTNLTICADQAALNAALVAACQAQYREGIDRPAITLSMNVLALSGTDQYAEYEAIERVGLGDTVRCVHDRLGISTTARVVEITWDCIKDRVSSVVVGSFKFDYFKNMGAKVDSITSILSPSGNVIAEKIAGVIDGAKTMIRLQTSVSEASPHLAVMYECTDENSPFYGACGIGTLGLMIASEKDEVTGEWIWTTAATGQGIIADTIVTGLLADKYGFNYWDLDTGQFHMTTGNVLLDDKTTPGTSNPMTLASYLQGQYAGLQEQIDGQAVTWFVSGNPNTQANLPAEMVWSSSQKPGHVDDLCYDRLSGKVYKYCYAYYGTLVEFSNKSATYNDNDYVIFYYELTVDGVQKVFETVAYAGDIGGKSLFLPTRQFWVRWVTNSTQNTGYGFYLKFSTMYGDQLEKGESSFSVPLTVIEAGAVSSLESDHYPYASGATDKVWYVSRGSGTSRAYRWVEITDNTLRAVLAVASTAQESADGKIRNFTSQPVPPYDLGDTWMQGSEGDIMVCIQARGAHEVFHITDWAKQNKYASAEEGGTNAMRRLTPMEICKKLFDDGRIKGGILEYEYDALGNIKTDSQGNPIARYYISFDAAMGGQLRLGGPNNGNGWLGIYDNAGNQIGIVDRNGVRLFETSVGEGQQNILFLDTNGSEPELYLFDYNNSANPPITYKEVVRSGKRVYYQNNTLVGQVDTKDNVYEGKFDLYRFRALDNSLFAMMDINGTYNYTDEYGLSALGVGGTVSFYKHVTFVGGYDDSSDIRLKKDVVPIGGVLDKVLALDVVRFHWKKNGNYVPAGFIAQNVQKVMPEFVHADDKGYLSVASSSLVPVLVKAVQEQNALIRRLEDRVSSLEKRLLRLERSGNAGQDT